MKPYHLNGHPVYLADEVDAKISELNKRYQTLVEVFVNTEIELDVAKQEIKRLKLQREELKEEIQKALNGDDIYTLDRRHY